MDRRSSLSIIAASVFFSTRRFPAGADEGDGQRVPLTIVVMDPLALPLSCPCVKGYAQRDYDKLGAYLAKELGRPVEVVFNESLEAAVKDQTEGRADIVIGKRSVVAAQAKRLSLPLKSALSLTGKDGKTTQNGLIVVPAADPAKSLSDLKDYRIIFGVPDCDEKYGAALTLLKKHGVTPPKDLETCAACSDGATTILELGPKVRAATVISSYAAPLLEGCGTIKKGDLRVVGTTDPLPFVTAFVSQKLSDSDRAAIESALRETKEEPLLLIAIESRFGFVPEPESEVTEAAAGPVKKKS